VGEIDGDDDLFFGGGRRERRVSRATESAAQNCQLR
jgi:hypothetical protein